MADGTQLVQIKVKSLSLHSQVRWGPYFPEAIDFTCEMDVAGLEFPVEVQAGADGLNDLAAQLSERLHKSVSALVVRPVDDTPLVAEDNSGNTF